MYVQVSLAVMVVIMFLGFACWHWKVRLLYYSDLAKERAQQRVHQVTQHVRDLVRRHRATITPAPTRGSHAEEDRGYN